MKLTESVQRHLTAEQHAVGDRESLYSADPCEHALNLQAALLPIIGTFSMHFLYEHMLHKGLLIQTLANDGYDIADENRWQEVVNHLQARWADAAQGLIKRIEIEEVRQRARGFRFTSLIPCTLCGGHEFRATVKMSRQCISPEHVAKPRWKRDSLLKQIALLKLLSCEPYGRPGRAYESEGNQYRVHTCRAPRVQVKGDKS